MSPDINIILCCIAMGPSAEWVMLHALQEAGVHGAKVHVLHVIPAYDATMAMPIVSFMGEEKFSQLVKEHKDETVVAIKKDIEELKERIIKEHLDESVDRIRNIHVYEGDPELEILHMADELGVDMIVMGTHSKGLTQYTFMGSVAKKVLKRSRVPMLLVPPLTAVTR
ncbi:MAG: universal stress protein [bacterium]|nr:universal stress protein [bacterium]MDT8365837.1 universal stress protein [bacterium]